MSAKKLFQFLFKQCFFLSSNVVTEAHTLVHTQPQTHITFFWFIFVIDFKTYTNFCMRPDLNLISYRFLWLWKFSCASVSFRVYLARSLLALSLPPTVSSVCYCYCWLLKLFGACDGTNNNCVCVAGTRVRTCILCCVYMTEAISNIRNHI